LSTLNRCAFDPAIARLRCDARLSVLNRRSGAHAQHRRRLSCSSLQRFEGDAMSRTAKTTRSNPSTTNDAVMNGNGADGELARMGIGGARQWWHQSLLVAQGTADLVEQMQRFNAQALHNWAESLALADREIEGADDMGALMAVPTQLVNRQLDLTLRHVNETTKLVLEAEVRWAERMREQAAAAGRSWMENLNRAGSTG
jgi:hypothetical protein